MCQGHLRLTSYQSRKGYRLWQDKGTAVVLAPLTPPRRARPSTVQTRKGALIFPGNELFLRKKATATFSNLYCLIYRLCIRRQENFTRPDKTNRSSRTSRLGTNSVNGKKKKKIQPEERSCLNVSYRFPSQDFFSRSGVI